MHCARGTCPGPSSATRPRSTRPVTLSGVKRRGCLSAALIVPAAIVALVERLGEPLMSATLAVGDGDGPLNDPDEIESRVGHQLDVIIDSGACGLESTTVIDLIESRDSDGDLTYAPVVLYEVEGVTYIWESSVSYGGALRPQIGDRRTLVYDPDDPSDATGRSLFLFILLPGFFLAGAVLFIGGVAFFQVRAGRQDAPVPKGIEYWQPPTASEPDPSGLTDRIEADFMGVEPSPLGADGTVRYRIKARAEIDGTMYRYRSEWMDDDPTLQLMQAGNKVTVRIDPFDPSRGEIETPDL